MKASVKTSAKIDKKAATVAPVTVPAKLQAIAKELAANKAGQRALSQEGESIMDRGSDTVKRLYKTREEAAPFLKAAFEAEKLTDMNAASQRSRILNYAFPANPEHLKAALEAPIRFKNGKGDIVEKMANVLQRNAIASGSFAPNKKGTLWLPVEKTGKQGPGSGAHNKRTPAENAKKAIEDSATAFITVGKNPAIAYFNLVVEVLSAVKAWKFDNEEAAKLLED